MSSRTYSGVNGVYIAMFGNKTLELSGVSPIVCFPHDRRPASTSSLEGGRRLDDGDLKSLGARFTRYH